MTGDIEIEILPGIASLAIAIPGNRRYDWNVPASPPKTGNAPAVGAISFLN